LSEGRPWAPIALGTGCLLAVALAVGLTWYADETATSPITPDGQAEDIYRWAVIAAFVLYVLGTWAVRTRGARLALVVVVAVAIQVAPLAAPVLFSTDVYTYWDYGRIGAVHGGNPYADPPSDWPGDPAYTLMGAQWHDTTSAYGPAWTLTSEGVAAIVGKSPDAAGWGFKAIGAAGALALVAAVAAAAPRRAFAAAFVGWNPVVALHFAGGGHNDALMMALPIAGLALAAVGRRELGGAAWAVGIAVKWLPLLFLPLVWARDRLRFGWVGFAGTAALLAAIAFAWYGVDWINAASPISSQLQRASSTSVPFQIEDLLGVPQRRVTQGLTLLFAIAYVWLLRLAWRTGRARLGLTAGLFCLALSWLPPWYVAWPLSLAAIEEDRAARWLALALSAWLVRDAVAF